MKDGMKARSTILRQIRQLRALSRDKTAPDPVRMKAYEVYHGLRWVVENTDWTPITLLRQEMNL